MTATSSVWSHSGQDRCSKALGGRPRPAPSRGHQHRLNDLIVYPVCAYRIELTAYSDEAGHAFQSEAGHPFRNEAGQCSDLKPAT